MKIAVFLIATLTIILILTACGGGGDGPDGFIMGPPKPECQVALAKPEGGAPSCIPEEK